MAAVAAVVARAAVGETAAAAVVPEALLTEAVMAVILARSASSVAEYVDSVGSMAMVQVVALVMLALPVLMLDFWTMPKEDVTPQVHELEMTAQGHRSRILSR